MLEINSMDFEGVSESEIQEICNLESQAMALFTLFVSEFETDSLAVQCFDLKLVEHSKHIKSRLKELGATYPYQPQLIL